MNASWRSQESPVRLLGVSTHPAEGAGEVSMRLLAHNCGEQVYNFNTEVQDLSELGVDNPNHSGYINFMLPLYDYSYIHYDCRLMGWIQGK